MRQFEEDFMVQVDDYEQIINYDWPYYSLLFLFAGLNNTPFMTFYCKMIVCLASLTQ